MFSSVETPPTHCHRNTCYGTEDGHVVKFAWVPASRTAEVDFLDHVKARNVQEVARMLAHQEITSTETLRAGLEFSKARQFKTSRLNLLEREGSANSSTTSLLPPISRSKGSSSASSTTTWQNRAFKCHVITPSGRRISKFESIEEIPEVSWAPL